jgi:hypothetical protein
MEYTFNLLLSFIFGIFFKIYDDIIDEKLKIDVIYIDLLKYVVITLFSIIFYNDFVFSIIWFEMASVSWLMDKYYTSTLDNSKDTIEQKDFTCMNDNLWIYSNLLSGVFIIYHIIVNYNGLTTFNIYDYKNITLLINIIINFFIVTIDIYFTPEHSSNNKLYVRIFVLLLLSTFVYYMSQFSEYIYEGNFGIMLMNIGFLISSVSFLTLKKYNVFDKLKNT